MLFSLYTLHGIRKKIQDIEDTDDSATCILLYTILQMLKNDRHLVGRTETRVFHTVFNYYYLISRKLRKKKSEILYR